MFAYEVACLT